jgi:predicted cobalt transporter CbtA
MCYRGHISKQVCVMPAVIHAGAGGGTVAASRTSLRASLATYATGIIYGLQPDALFVVVPALALPTKVCGGLRQCQVP